MIDPSRRLVPSTVPEDHPIHDAAEAGELARVRAFLDQQPSLVHDINRAGGHPLHRAAIGGSADVVTLLLERGAGSTWPDADSSERGAALHAAARRGDREMVELLLKHHADPNGFVNASGNAVYAAKTPEIRRLLEAHGGFLDPYDLVWKGEDDEVMRIVTERPETALAGCGGVFTAVVTCGRRKLMRRLLDAGFKVHPQPGGCHAYLLERPDMLRELLTRGGLDPNYPTDEGVTLLHELCHKDSRGRAMDHRTECAAILLEFGADPSPKDTHGETPVIWATKHALTDIAGFLKARGAT